MPTIINDVSEKIMTAGNLKSLDIDAVIQKIGLQKDFELSEDINSKKGPIQEGSVITSLPIVLSTPGTYQLSDNLTWKDDGEHYPIMITTSGVTLDFAGKHLKIERSDNGTMLPGVVVAGCNHVTIKNGTIINPCQFGILSVIVGGVTVNPVNIQKMIVQDLGYEKLGDAKGFAAGIASFSSYQLNIDTCTVTFTSKPDFPLKVASAAGVLFMACSDSYVTNCSVNGLINHDGAAIGYCYALSRDITTTGCHSTNFQTIYKGETDAVGHTCIGFMPTACFSLRFNGCESKSMIGCCDDCHGFSVFMAANVTITDFSADGIHDGRTPKNSGAKATGLEVYGWDVSVANSTVSNITARVPQDLQCAGFSAAGADIQFTSCSASNVHVHNQAGQNDTAYGNGIGFGWAPDPRKEFVTMLAEKVSIEQCQAENCDVGVDLWNYVNCTGKDITITGCKQNYLNESTSATRTLSMDKCSELTYAKKLTLEIENKAEGNNFPGS